MAEAWELVKRPVNQKLIGKDYIDLIEAEGRAAYGELKKHFGESNLLHKLRNTIAYHHPSAEELEAAFEDVPEDEDWAWYPSDTINNSFYLASDSGILRVTGETDTAKAFDKVGRGRARVGRHDQLFPVFDARHCYATSRRGCFDPAQRNKNRQCAESIQGCDPIFHGERRQSETRRTLTEHLTDATRGESIFLYF